ncbi:hypothetical protein ACN9ML_00295 [Dyadobacter endophyticus]
MLLIAMQIYKSLRRIDNFPVCWLVKVEGAMGYFSPTKEGNSNMK